jgi:hypothetical protein
VEKNGKLYIPPIQYNIDTHSWVPLGEGDSNWDKKPWIIGCGGCHATGVNIEKNSFVEPGVGCEACHGPGSWHAALPKTAVFEKRQTIINPSKLTMGVAVQICGSCHTRGESTMVQGAGWPVGYEPGMALGPFFKEPTIAAGDVKVAYAKEFAKGHHSQYLDWKQSVHFTEGVTCTSCHFVHQIGMPPTRSQTVMAGSRQCMTCHVLENKLRMHAIHSFGNCVGCHMPRIAHSAESGDIHSHVFVCLLPKDTEANPAIPNSCQVCHKLKEEAPKEEAPKEATWGQDGKKIYDDKCAACHGEKGDGNGPLSATFSPPPGPLTDPKFWKGDVNKKISDSITEGTKQMTPIDLKPDEIKAVTAYMKKAFKK